MNLEQQLMQKKAKVLQVDNFIFDNLIYHFHSEENEMFYKLYLLQKGEHQYSVFACTKYIRDHSLDHLKPFDLVPYPLSLHLQKDFSTREEAQTFYDTILQYCPAKLDLAAILPKTCKVYEFDDRKSVNYDFFKGTLKRDDFFEKEFIRHGYQRMFIRMFRFQNKIIINKNVSLEFTLEEEATHVFSLIQNHFTNEPFTTFPCDNEETKLHTLLEQLMMKATKGKNVEIKMERDFLDRVTNFRANFKMNDIGYAITYKLPTRNGYQIDASIYSTKNGYEPYRVEELFKQEITKILAC